MESFCLFSNDGLSLSNDAVSHSSCAVSNFFYYFDSLLSLSGESVSCVSSSGLVACAGSEGHCHSGNEHKCNLFHFLFFSFLIL